MLLDKSNAPNEKFSQEAIDAKWLRYIFIY